MSSTAKGISCPFLAVLVASLQSVAIKWVGGSYSALEVVVIRTLVALPLSILWGVLIWHQVPTLLPLAGAMLTLASGLYVFYRAQGQAV